MEKNNTLVFLLVGLAIFFVFVMYRKVTSPLYGGSIGVAGGAVALPPASSTASTINAILAGSASTIPSILSGISTLFHNPTGGTGVAGSGQLGASGGGSNVPGSYTGAGPVNELDGNYYMDYSTVGYDPSTSLESDSFPDYAVGSDSYAV
jgi:hypothetical protein